MDEILLTYGKVISLTLTGILFLISVYKIFQGRKTRENYFLIIIIFILGCRIFFLPVPYISFILLIALIYIIGKYHYHLNKIQEVLIWRICNITVILVTLLSGFTSLFKHNFYFLFEIFIIVFYVVFQFIFLIKKLKIQYTALFSLLWISKIIYVGAALYDILANALNFRITNIVIWISVIVNLYLGFLVIFKEELLFPGTGKKNKNRYSTYTKLVDTEDMLILQNKLVQAGLLAAGITHELKNIFFTINTSVQLALSRNNPEIYTQCLQIIQASSEKGRLFTETILKKINHGEKPKEKIQLAGELDKLLKIVKANYRGEGILFSSQVDSKLFLFAGKTDFEQIILNLISNSINALNKEEKAEKYIRVSAKQLEDKIVIDIIDNGPGIPRDMEFTLFNPNVSGNNSTGLGLYIADLLVKRNNGILVYYPLDQGSDFRITFETRDLDFPDNAW